MLALGRSYVVRRTLGVLVIATAAYFAYLLWVDVDAYRDWSELLDSNALTTAGLYVIDTTDDLVDWSVRATTVLFMAWLWTMRREVASRLAIVWWAITGSAIATGALVELAWRTVEQPNFRALGGLAVFTSAICLASALLAAEILRRANVNGTPSVAEPALGPT